VSFCEIISYDEEKVDCLILFEEFHEIFLEYFECIYFVSEILIKVRKAFKMPMMIVFDKLTYTPGSVVSGHVIIVKKAPEKVKGLTMRFIGRSSKLMSESDSVKNYKKEVYFDEKVDIFGHGEFACANFYD